MGSGWNPFKAIKNFISDVFKSVKYLVQLKLDRAIQYAIKGAIDRFLIPTGFYIEDHYKDITNIDSKMYNFLGNNKPDNLILDSIQRSIIQQQETFTEAIVNDLFNGGALKFQRYLNWVNRSGFYDVLGFYSTNITSFIDNSTITNAVNSVLGNVTLYPQSASLGKISNCMLTLGYTFALKQGLNLEDLRLVQVYDPDIQTYAAEFAIDSNENVHRYYFTLASLNLDPSKEYAACIYSATENHTYWREEDISPLSLPLVQNTVTKTFIYGETGYSTYSATDVAEEYNIPPYFVESVTLEEQTDPAYKEPIHVYTVIYSTVDNTAPEMSQSSTRNYYYTYDENTFTAKKHISETVREETGVWKPYWYAYNSGIPALDRLWSWQDTSTNIWAPPIPVRTWTQPVTQGLFPYYYPWLKKACRKAFSDRNFYSNLVKQIDSNESADSIDFAYIMHGVAINRKEDYALEYLVKFWLYMAAYKYNFSPVKYDLTFNPYTVGRKVFFSEHSYDYEFAFGINTSVTHDPFDCVLNWRLLWSDLGYQTFFANKTPSKEYWLEYKYVSPDTYETGNIGHICIAVSLDKYTNTSYFTYNAETSDNAPIYVTERVESISTKLSFSYFVDFTLNTSRHVYQYNVSPAMIEALGSGSVTLCNDSPEWVGAGNLITTKWHKPTAEELAYILNKSHLNSDPFTQFLAWYRANVGSIDASQFNIESPTTGTTCVILESSRKRYDYAFNFAYSLGWNGQYGTNCRFSRLNTLSTNVIGDTYSKQIQYTNSDTDRSFTHTDEYPWIITCITKPKLGTAIRGNDLGGVGSKLAEYSRYAFNTHSGLIFNAAEVDTLQEGYQLIFNRHISNSYCERAFVTNLKVQNQVIDDMYKVYEAKDYWNSTDGSDGVCPIIIPINKTVFKQMTLRNRNEVLQISNHLLINIFVRERVKVKWYTNKVFLTVVKIAMIVVIIVVSIFSFGSLTAPMTGLAGIIYGAVSVVVTNVVLATIITKLVIAVIVSIVCQLIAKIVGRLTGNALIGQVVGAIAAVVAISYSGLGPTQGFGELLNTLTDPKTWCSLGMKAIEALNNYQNQNTQNKALALAQEQNTFQSQYQENTEQMWQSTLAMSSSSSYFQEIAKKMWFNPYIGQDIAYSTADSNSIYDISQSVVYNDYDTYLQLSYD